MKIGLLHPGAMGVTIGQALLASGHNVYWQAQGRSPQTTARAVNFRARPTLSALVAEVEAIVSVCPPGAAFALAQQVADAGFVGPYLDANAIAPTTAKRIADVFVENYIDGGIIGPPAIKPDTTRLYLSGSRAAEAAQWFSAGVLGVDTMCGETTAASALKMAYAAYTKGSSALLLAVNALAEQNGVRETLNHEWALSQPGLIARSELTAANVSPKAWRFVAEMREIAQTFDDAGLPAGFHEAAADFYQRMASLKGSSDVSMAQVLTEVLIHDGS